MVFSIWWRSLERELVMFGFGTKRYTGNVIIATVPRHLFELGVKQLVYI